MKYLLFKYLINKSIKENLWQDITLEVSENIKVFNLDQRRVKLRVF